LLHSKQALSFLQELRFERHGSSGVKGVGHQKVRELKTLFTPLGRGKGFVQNNNTIRRYFCSAKELFIGSFF
jgi:hypothetical protein